MLRLFILCRMQDFEVRVHIRNCEDGCKDKCGLYHEHVQILGEYRGVQMETSGVGKMIPIRDIDTHRHEKVFREDK